MNSGEIFHGEGLLNVNPHHPHQASLLLLTGMLIIEVIEARLTWRCTMFLTCSSFL